MKTSYKIAFALTALAGVGLAIAGPVVADGGKRGGGHDGGGRGQAAMMLFEKADMDGNSQVTREEADAFVSGQLSANDADTSGSLSLAEFEGVWLEQMRTSMVRAFQRLDQDGDGNVTPTEINHPVDRMFDRADRNDDGMIEASELRRKGHGDRRRDRDDDDDDS